MQINASALRGLLKSRGSIQLPSNGTSMFPVIRTRSVCRFEPVEPGTLQTGDIVLFVSHSGELVGHRYHRSVVNHGATFYIFKGDSNKNPDSPVSPEQIIGKMTSIQYHKFQMRTDHILLKMWGDWMVKFPLLSLSIHYSLRIKTKIHGMKLRKG